MNTVQLEKFSNPVYPGMPARIISPPELEALKKQAYEDGVHAGAAAASSAFKDAETRALFETREVIADAFFSREEAHKLALNSLQPLIIRIVDTMAPSLAISGLGAEIANVVMQALHTVSIDELTICVPVNTANAIRAQLQSRDLLVKVNEDPELNSAQTRIEWQNGFDLIDLDLVAHRIRDTLDAFFAETTAVKSTGTNNA